MRNIRLEDVDARLAEEGRAIRARNGFSRLLHERCMAALRREGPTGSGTAPGRRRAWWGPVLGGAVAAAVALGVWLMVRTPPTPVRSGSGTQMAQGTDVPEVIETGFDSPIAMPAAALDARKYAYLDRDAKRLLVFVANQFPGFPSEPVTQEAGNGEPVPK